jgi:hypothetical protein
MAAATAAVPISTETSQAVPRKKGSVLIAERWRASHASADAVDSVNRFYAAIQAPEKLYENNEPLASEAVETVKTLQEAAHLFTFAASPSEGLLAELLGGTALERRVPLTLLKALGADGVVRAKSVDSGLARMLRSATASPNRASAILARVPKQLRPLLALRFFSISGFDIGRSAENMQTGIEVVLTDEMMELCDGNPVQRDECVDELGGAMDVLCATVPKAKIMQSALDAALAHRRTPPDCLEAFSDVTDDCVCPDMSWIHELEPSCEDDEEEKEDEE